MSKVVIKFVYVFCCIDDDIALANSKAMEEMIMKQLETVMEGVPGK